MQDIIASLNRYTDQKIETGGFLRAVLENNLFGAYARADHKNITQIREIVMYINQNLPTICYGSPEKVNKFLNS